MSSLLRAVLDLLLPSTALTVLCIIGAALSILRPRRRSPLLITGATGLALVLLLPVDLLLLRPLEDRFPPASLPQHIDGVVVLGGAISATISADRGIPTLNRDADRLVAFASLARGFPDAKLIFAGGPPPSIQGRLTESQATLTLLGSLGIPPSRITVEEQSRTTWENAVNALALAHPLPGETWVLVTSASHMPRAMGSFRKAGWPPMLAWPVAYRTTNEVWQTPLQPMGAKLAAADLAAHEWAGLIAYRLQGRMDRLLPGP